GTYSTNRTEQFSISTVQCSYSHWCDVTDQAESGNFTILTYRCDGDVWRRGFGTSTDLATGMLNY
ncbi:hypothetical protein DPMN_144614, partial [Dreissena polymorpha]